jgi:copper transport protein
MSVSKIIIFFLVISYISSLYLVNFNIYIHAQVEATIGSTATTEAVTSINDAILKSLVIISQVAVLGIVFNHFFFNRFLDKKRGNNTTYEPPQTDIMYFNVRTQKRVTSIVAICCISIIIFATFSILLQTYQLAQNLNKDMLSTFDILFNSSVGQVWILRVVTSSAIIGLMMGIYYITLRKNNRTDKIDRKNFEKLSVSKIYRGNNIPNQILLLIVIALSSANLFSNSMVGHSNSLPSFSSFAVSMDWIHFMAVSIWIGGLFYLSLVLVKNLKPIDDHNDKSNSTNTIATVSNSIRSVHNMSIALMYFSFIVIVALCIIGISGLYLGYMHLQDLNSVFNTSYGQILVLKLGLAFPLIFIGRYNQLKIYKYTSRTSNLLKDVDKNTDIILTQQYGQERTNIFESLNKSLKIESLLGISVLIVASFLSVTSPPSLEAIDQGSSINQNDNLYNGPNNPFFFCLIIILAIIITIIGIMNFKKNQKQIKEISALTK